uniref:Uncharacterized protein n=1 Tax=Parascaris univalens TaxID=6257 RepID=A0A915A4V0_PARUN
MGSITVGSRYCISRTIRKTSCMAPQEMSSVLHTSVQSC